MKLAFIWAVGLRQQAFSLIWTHQTNIYEVFVVWGFWKTRNQAFNELRHFKNLNTSINTFEIIKIGVCFDGSTVMAFITVDYIPQLCV